MAISSRQIGWGTESNLLWQILKQLTRLTSIMFSLKPKYKVFTALLTQTGGDSPNTKAQGDTLDLGVSYYIDINSENADLTIFGAPNSDVGTYFICTQVGTLPVIGTISLISNLGAPVATILEDTINGLGFEYISQGLYKLHSNDKFISGKTVVFVTTNSKTSTLPQVTQYQVILQIIEYEQPGTLFLTTGDVEGNLLDDIIQAPNYPATIEIRVYN